MFIGKINRFLRDRIASIAPILAVMAVPIILVAGAATDVTRHHNANEHVQMALDSAGLAAARHARLNMATPSDTLNAEIVEIAQHYFDAELKNRDEFSMQTLTVTRNGPKLLLSVKGELPTSFMRMTGKTTLEVDTQTEVTIGVPSSVEMALVLDMSDSMGSGGRLTALQAAATDLIDTLVDPNSDKVKISIVPFGQYVNVGTSHRNESWIRVPSNRDEVQERCRTNEEFLDQHCGWQEYPCPGRDGGALATCTRRKCSERVWRESFRNRICEDETIPWRWHGCVQSRRPPDNIRDSNYTNQIQGLLTTSLNHCARPITPLTNNRDVLRREVRNLSARGDTHMPSGLTWGWRTLSNIAPFDEGKEMTTLQAEGGSKTLVLMSDGANSLVTANTGQHRKVNGSFVLQFGVDERTKDVCDNIKNAQIEIYTIAFDVNNSRTESLLQRCASSPAHAFVAENANELKDVFVTITESILRDIAVSA